VAIAYVFEWDTDSVATDGFDAVIGHSRMVDDPPPGLLSLAAGHTGDGVFRIFEVWENAADREEFERTRLEPAIDSVAGASGGPPDRERSYDLHLFSSEAPA
jgi:hypothetical protein